MLANFDRSQLRLASPTYGSISISEVQAESARADKVAIQYRHLKKEYDELRKRFEEATVRYVEVLAA